MKKSALRRGLHSLFTACFVARCRHPHAAWSVFFGIFSLLMVVTLVMPATFGFQSFTQWGGMYDDNWCNAELFSADPHTTPPEQLQQDYLAVGYGKSRVYSTPVHNMESCLMWLKMLCGKPSGKGWDIQWIRPLFKKVAYLEPRNACDTPVTGAVEWFKYYD